MACHLIAFNKCSGVGPIGIGEILCRVIGKAFCSPTCFDAALVCVSGQGLQAGIEGAIHAMNNLFTTHQLKDHKNGWGVLLVMASLCSLYTYRGWSVLVLIKSSSKFLYSKKGAT